MEQSSTQTLFLEFHLNQNTLSRAMTFSFPADVVPDSQRATVSAVGMCFCVSTVRDFLAVIRLLLSANTSSDPLLYMSMLKVTFWAHPLEIWTLSLRCRMVVVSRT